VSYILAADTGGTFTDLAAYEKGSGRMVYTKSLTTYDDLVRGVMDCIRKARIDLHDVDLIKFGTTLIINTYVQRSGARAALVMTEGFRDVLEIGRGNRTMPFDLRYRRDPILVERDRRYEVAGRIAPSGEITQPMPADAAEQLLAEFRKAGIEAVAVSLHNSYANAAHEEALAADLRRLAPDLYVTAGTELSREWHEFERASTAAANAYVGPTLKDYVKRLDTNLKAGGFSKTFYLMASNGGVFSVERAQRQPVMLVESGPVGGCIGAGAYGLELGLSKVIGFDMGGTTAKCAILEDGRFEVKSPYYVGGPDSGFPVRGGVLDIIEVGTGGGSIAWLDGQGNLAVGPRSAGSTPGPACYGRGGTEPTITDANLVLGRIGAASFLGGEMRLDTHAAQSVIFALADRMNLRAATREQTLDQMASGILGLATLSMASAIKQITMERGLDPREFPLVAFGGGGPLHCGTLARELSLPEVIVPPEPGVFSALGMLLSDARVDETRTYLAPLKDENMAGMHAQLDAMEASITAALARELGAVKLQFERQAEMRFHGQRHTVRVPVARGSAAAAVRTAFEAAYSRRYGFVETNAPVECVSLLVTATASLERAEPSRIAPVTVAAGEPATRSVFFPERSGRLETPVLGRSTLPIGFEAQGPAVIEEYGSTTVVGPDDRFRIGRLGEIHIQFPGKAA
jgi:N-methylhydantoinase A